MQDLNRPNKKMEQGASCNAKISTGFYVFLGLLAIGAAVYFLFFR